MRRLLVAAVLVVALVPIVARAGTGPLKAKPTSTELEAIESLERRQAEINARGQQVLDEARERFKRDGLFVEGWDPKARSWSVTEIAPESSGGAIAPPNSSTKP